MSQRAWHNVKDIADVRTALRALMPTPLIAYTPAWTGSSSDPSIGDGTLSAHYTKNAFTCFVRIEMTFGSTSNAGSGTWSFSLPVARAGNERVCGSLLIKDSGTTRHAGASVIDTAAGTVVRGYVHGNNNYVGSAAPITWANGDILLISIQYPTEWGV